MFCITFIRKRALLRRMKSIFYGTVDVEDGMVDAWLGFGYIVIALKMLLMFFCKLKIVYLTGGKV